MQMERAAEESADKPVGHRLQGDILLRGGTYAIVYADNM